jgi:hypothetical protein
VRFQENETMAGKDKPRAERRKEPDMSEADRRALKKAKRREKKHALQILRRKATRTGHAAR